MYYEDQKLVATKSENKEVELESEMMKELNNDALRHMGLLEQANYQSYQPSFKYKFYANLRWDNEVRI